MQHIDYGIERNASKRNLLNFILPLLFIFEFLLLKGYLTREITPYYPTNFDQTTFLLISYTFYENIKVHGLFYALHHTELLATGILFPIQATLFYFMLGATRFNALLPNFIYFIALQLILFLTVKFITRKTTLAFTAVGLLLCVHTPFITYGGGISDFRMDFIAFCLYGIFISTVLYSNLFLSTRSSLLAAACASLLVLFRTITVVYLSLLMSILFFWLIISKDKIRLKNFLWSGSIFLLIIFPYIWINKDTLYGYYVFNHVIGYDKIIRAIEMGTTTPFASWIFYPLSLFKYHIGIIGCLACGFLLSSYFFLYVFSSHLKKDRIFNDKRFIFLIFSLIIPLTILTLDTSKSPVVGSILVMPLIWLTLWVIYYLQKNIPYKKPIAIIAFIVFFMGCGYQYHSYTHHFRNEHYNDLLAINKMYQTMGDYSVKNNLETLHLSFDQIIDYFTPPGITVWYYEHNKKMLKIDANLGSAIFSINLNEIMPKVRASNIIILNQKDYHSKSPYPFNNDIVKYQSQLRQYVSKNFKLLTEASFMDKIYRVYVK